ncbi:MAG TPA: ATP-binding protein [Anaeromyxobacteraceae bacterium]|nr:ATP-binding protein [Anaeromyxobacteraceae bacterium]
MREAPGDHRPAGASLDAYVVISSDDRLVAYNEHAIRLWGLSQDEAARIASLGRTEKARQAFIDANANHSLDPLAFRASIAQLTPSTIFSDEVPLRDGRVIERHGAPTHDAQGRITGRSVFFRDVTARKRMEADLMDRARQQASVAALGELAMNSEELEPLLHAACGSVVDVLGVDTAALLELSANRARLAVRAAAGFSVDVVGAELEVGALTQAGTAVESMGATVAADAAARWPADPFLRAHRLASGAAVVLPGRDGCFGVLGAWSRTPRNLGADQVRFLQAAAGVLAAAVARHRAEQGVLEGERQMRAVFDAALDAMLIVDDRGTVCDANPAACALFAAGRSALRGRNLGELTVGVAGAALGADRYPGAHALGRSAGELSFDVPGQGPRTVEYSTVPSILPGRHLAVLRDVTSQRQLRARLALADRMASVGTLAAGVAHELNNPLAYVNANLSFLAERLGGADRGLSDERGGLQEAVRDARDGVDRMRVIIRDLKTFSRADDEGLGPVDLGPVLESCISMAWNEIRHRARLVRDLAAVPPVPGSEARLGQVFLNLLVNAAHAIPEGHAEGNEIRVSTSHRPDDWVIVEVRDSGSGIRPEHRPRIFDPFFTTKAPGVGTGLGLSICHGIVTALGGEIEVETEVGRGSVFRVLLPPAPREQVREAAPAPAGAHAIRGKILVVDDEPLVGSVLQRTLQSEHDVTVVGSARAALDALERGEQFDVVLSDLLMPEMTGMDLYRELVRREPALARRVVFLTGGAFTTAAREFLEREAVLCVEKPFELDAIRGVLTRKLAEVRAL